MAYKHRLTDADQAEIVRLYHLHGRTTPVAEEMGCSTTAVRRALGKRGIRLERGVGNRNGEKRYSPVQPDELDRVCEAGERYAAWREQRRALQRAEYGLPPKLPLEGPWDGRSL